MSQSIPAAAYLRFSSERQNASSIDDQRRVCARTAATRGCELVTEFVDEAQSGASANRDGLQRLLAAVQRGQTPPFLVVFVDDQSRLSRNLEDTLRITRQLHERGVEIFDCSTGTSSRGANSKVINTVRGLISEIYLDDLRHKTRRGLEGRALAGCCTGGRLFGYSSEPEANPNDPDHPRYIIRVDQREAEVVRRIFTLRSEGASLDEICGVLNREKVAAPGDARERKAVRGWSKNQVSYTLRNEQYRGRVVWNRREWFKVDGKRRCRKRPKSEWVTAERPELAIIDADTWARVQALRKRTTSGKGQARVSRRTHMLSGLLRCSSCGGALTIVLSRNEKNRAKSSYFGCSAYHSKGEAACPNATTISEPRLNQAVVDAVLAFVQGPRFASWVQAGLDKEEREARVAAQDDPRARVEAALRAQEAKVARVVDLLIDQESDALRARLRQEEAKLQALRAELADAPAPQGAAEVVRLTAEAVTAAMRDAACVVHQDPMKARLLVSALLSPIVLRPVEQGLELEIRIKREGAPCGDALTTASSCGGRI